MMKRIILKPGEEKRILAGHPWVYDNEVARILAPVPGGFKPIAPGELEAGEPVDVESAHKTYLGRGLANPHSKIIARIYSPSKEGVDKGFFKRRIRTALTGRLPGYDLRRESARIIFGEADFLPGLIVDRFVGWPFEEIETRIAGESLTFEKVEAALGRAASWLSIQFLAWGMDRRREEILAALEEVLEKYSPPEFRSSAAGGIPGNCPLGAPAGIVERSAARIRELEGLPPGKGILRGNCPPGGIVIFENGLPFIVHLEEGQKTGHYLDQKENRLRAAAFAAGGRVLDGCAYTGGFGIHAAKFGAAEPGFAEPGAAELGAAGRSYPQVIALDVSAVALETLRKNARLNGVEDRLTLVEGDIFEVLRSYERAKERFDLIILDPPAFAKSHSALEGALRGYKEINLRAIKLLVPGGVLVTCSCSQALDEGRFKALIAEAAADADRRLCQLDFRYQAPDHPILVGYDESLYLKCGYYRAL